MSNIELITIIKAIRLWIQGVEDPRITKERLIKNLLKEVKDDALHNLQGYEDEDYFYLEVLEDVESGEIKDEDIRELVEIVLTLRKQGLKKAQIQKSVERHFDIKYKTEWRRSRTSGFNYRIRHWSPQIYYLFNIVYDYWMPPYPRGRRRPRVYPIERLKKLRAQGLSYREIEKETGVPKSTAHRILTKGQA